MYTGEPGHHLSIQGETNHLCIQGEELDIETDAACSPVSNI